jgi:hypothetical protein
MATTKKKKEYCVHVGASYSPPMSTACFKTKAHAQRFAREARREGGSPVRMQVLSGAPSWWPFGHKKAKPSARHPMTRTVYYARTASGTYKPVDRPPSSAVMAGARRRKRRR